MFAAKLTTLGHYIAKTRFDSTDPSKLTPRLGGTTSKGQSDLAAKMETSWGRREASHLQGGTPSEG